MNKLTGLKQEVFLDYLECTITYLEENPAKLYTESTVFNVDTDYGIVTITLPNKLINEGE